MTCLGYGLFFGLLKGNESYATQEGIQLLPGIGIGLAINTPMIIIQAAMPAKEMAASMSAWMLVRSIAAAVGESRLSISQIPKRFISPKT